MNYPLETLSADYDDGTMVDNVAEFEHEIIGHKIVTAEKDGRTFTITLDNGKRVSLVDTGDCCAFTELESFLLNVDAVDHMVMGVGTTDEYSTWHVYADFGDIMELQVGWNCGNPFYYGYGFQIKVEDVAETKET